MGQTWSNKLMWVYAVLMVILSYAFIQDDINTGRSLGYVSWMALGYILMCCGNFLYLSDLRKNFKTWILVPIVLVINLFVSIFIDSTQERSINFEEVVIVIFVLLIFTPSLRANYLLSKRKVEI